MDKGKERGIKENWDNRRIREKIKKDEFKWGREDWGRDFEIRRIRKDL